MIPTAATATYAPDAPLAPAGLPAFLPLRPVVSLLGPAVRAKAQDMTKKMFDLPADDATATLKQFSEQSGAQIIFPGATVKGVTTNAVKGEFTAKEAIDRMLAGTGLYAVRDESSGSFAVNRQGSKKKAEGPSQTSPLATPDGLAAEDKTIQLSPFDVRADPDNSYGALNSNSLTAFNTALDHLPVSADIFDQAFMNDVSATSVEAMIQSYSAGAGFSGLNAGNTAAANQPGDRVGLSYLQLRGSKVPTMQRDSLLFVGTFGNPGGTGIGTTSNFDIERVEVIDGPQAMLYDGGGAGGVINVVSKQARLGQPTFGSYLFRTDQYGTKYGQLDYGTSRGDLAVRVAVVDASDSSRRVNVGDQLNGAYVQFAYQLGKTTLRLSLEQTVDWHLNSTAQSLTATSGDPFFSSNGDALTYLLATNKAGGVLGGQLNWNNVNSWAGVQDADLVVAEFGTLSADTQWTSWLSTQLSVGASNFVDDTNNAAVSLYAPATTSNPLPGNWTESLSAATPDSDAIRPYRGKAARFSVLATNELFGGGAKSQTIFGIDYIGARGAILQNDYYQADSNWNAIVNPALTANGGRTLIPKLSWTANNGLLEYPLFNPFANRVTINGVNYVRQAENPMNPSYVTPTDQLGTTIPGGADGLANEDLNEGIYAMNYSQWMNEKLDTLLGVRLEKAYTYTANPGNPPGSPPVATPINIAANNSFNFSVGADYHVLPWLAPYFTVSDSYVLAPDLTSDDLSNVLPVAHAVGEEAGFKINSANGGISGSISLYHVNNTNEEFLTTATLSSDINPSGLNGRFDPGGGNGYVANIVSNGLQATLTATPTKNWRMRLSAAYENGTIGSTVSNSLLYNDQFHENSSGEVTYSDGTIVYVPVTFNSKQLTVTSTTAGAIPFTVALISTPTSSYYANPNLTTGGINSGSAAASVLRAADPVHGAILTGVTGLPISALQLVAADIPGLSPPSAATIVQSGDTTTGSPKYSANFTNLYVFPSGWLKGFKVGSTVSGSWKIGDYYYYSSGATASGAGRTLFSLPAQSRFDLILGYERRLGRITFSTQLNVNNIFNCYQIIIMPDYLTGYNTISNLNATFTQQPRLISWTNRISF